MNYKESVEGLTVHSSEELAATAPIDSVTRHDLEAAEHTTTVLFTGPAGRARTHIHSEHDEVCALLTGSGTITIGAETRAMHAGDIVVIPAGLPHSAHFHERYRMLSVYGPFDDPAAPDREWVEDPPDSGGGMSSVG